MKLNTIYNEDCLEGMKRIPDGSVDMTLARWAAFSSKPVNKQKISY